MFPLDAFLFSPRQQDVLTTCNMLNAYVCSETRRDRDGAGETETKAWPDTPQRSLET